MEIALLSALIVSNILWFWRLHELQKKRSRNQELLEELSRWFGDVQRETGLLKVERVDPSSVYLVPPYRR